MLDLVDDIRRDRGLTIMMVSHLPDDAARIAQHVAFIEDGHVVGVFEIDTLFGENPPSEIAAYLHLPAKE
jgi:thiamine transport system ATP-binding protein